MGMNFYDVRDSLSCAEELQALMENVATELWNYHGDIHLAVEDFLTVFNLPPGDAEEFFKL